MELFLVILVYKCFGNVVTKNYITTKLNGYFVLEKKNYDLVPKTIYIHQINTILGG